MGLETGNFFEDLDISWPVGGDGVVEGDNHIRLLKKILKQQFTNGPGGQGLNGAVDVSVEEFNFLIGATSSIQDQLDTLGELIADNGSVPIGGIIMYNGAFIDIATNFQLCDGTNGTPDLTSQFVYGTNTELELGDAGGSADAIVVSHNHTANHDHPNATTSSDGSHTHAYNSVNPSGSGDVGLYNDGNAGNQFPSSTAGAHTHTLNIPNLDVTTSTKGSSGTNANLPPYIKLAYIIRMS